MQLATDLKQHPSRRACRFVDRVGAVGHVPDGAAEARTSHLPSAYQTSPSRLCRRGTHQPGTAQRRIRYRRACAPVAPASRSHTQNLVPMPPAWPMRAGTARLKNEPQAQDSLPGRCVPGWHNRGAGSDGRPLLGRSVPGRHNRGAATDRSARRQNDHPQVRAERVREFHGDQARSRVAWGPSRLRYLRRPSSGGPVTAGPGSPPPVPGSRLARGGSLTVESMWITPVDGQGV